MFGLQENVPQVFRKFCEINKYGLTASVCNPEKRTRFSDFILLQCERKLEVALNIVLAKQNCLTYLPLCLNHAVISDDVHHVPEVQAYSRRSE